MAKKKEEQTPHPMDSIIENIKTDQALLDEKELLINQAKADKFDVQQRLKGYRKDLSVFLKYATEEQIQEVEALGFGSDDHAHRMNEVAQITLDIMNQKKKLTNNEIKMSVNPLTNPTLKIRCCLKSLYNFVPTSEKLDSVRFCCV